MIKRVLSVSAALCLVLTLFCMPVSARAPALPLYGLTVVGISYDERDSGFDWRFPQNFNYHESGSGAHYTFDVPVDDAFFISFKYDVDGQSSGTYYYIDDVSQRPYTSNTYDPRVSGGITVGYKEFATYKTEAIDSCYYGGQTEFRLMKAGAAFPHTQKEITITINWV